MRFITHAFSLLVPSGLKRLTRRYLPGVYRTLYRYAYSHDEPAAQEIRAGRLVGRRLVCRPLLEAHYLAGTYEPDVQAAAARLILPGMVVYDIGVHRGYFTLLFADLVGPAGQVIGFEPLPGNLALARQSTGFNQDLASRIRFVPLAVSDSPGEAHLVEVERYSSMAKLTDEPSESDAPGHITVNTTSLDDFVREGNPVPQFVKMDIEGAESKALPGMAELLRTARPTILVEVHNDMAYAAFAAILRDHSYVGAKLGNNTFSTSPPWTGKDQYLAIPGEVRPAGLCK
jgi:FkbM family methyltransferase